MVLNQRELWQHVAEELPVPIEVDQAEAFRKKEEKVLAAIALSIEPEHHIHILDCKRASKAQETLGKDKELQRQPQRNDTKFRSTEIKGMLISEFERKIVREPENNDTKKEAYHQSKDAGGQRKEREKEDKKCYKCGKQGHLAKDCWARSSDVNGYEHIYLKWTYEIFADDEQEANDGNNKSKTEMAEQLVNDEANETNSDPEIVEKLKVNQRT
ncbi:hypothetical protein KM043_013370 [Ampulex compressa]|nr:hypothetical protein KM043_013370 [Ampulex compressa]